MKDTEFSVTFIQIKKNPEDIDWVHASGFEKKKPTKTFPFFPLRYFVFTNESLNWGLKCLVSYPMSKTWFQMNRNDLFVSSLKKKKKISIQIRSTQKELKISRTCQKTKQLHDVLPLIPLKPTDISAKFNLKKQGWIPARGSWVPRTPRLGCPGLFPGCSSRAGQREVGASPGFVFLEVMGNAAETPTTVSFHFPLLHLCCSNFCLLICLLPGGFWYLCVHPASSLLSPSLVYAWEKRCIWKHLFWALVSGILSPTHTRNREGSV